ncbi:MAG: TetR/AcrR family transcriptional regulator [Candidatus Dormiibacterota bacterium]
MPTVQRGTPEPSGARPQPGARRPTARSASPEPPGEHPSASKTSTRERILVAYLKVASERGLEAATTRVIAQAAGVNEVTLFRHFGDKASLALAAVREFSPVAELRIRDPQIDVSSPRRAALGLEACLRYCSERLRARPEAFDFGIGEARRMPAVAAEITAIPRAVMEFFGRALAQAAPRLRPDVDHRATVLQWMGLLVVTRLWAARQAMPELSTREWDEVIAAAVAAVIDWAGDENEAGG